MAGFLDGTTANKILTALHGGTALAITGPIKLLFLSALRANAFGSDTEWSTSGGYTAGTGYSGVTYAAAANVSNVATQVANGTLPSITNAPAGTWAGCVEADSTGTPQKLFVQARTGGSATVNSGDTVVVSSLTDTL